MIKNPLGKLEQRSVKAVEGPNGVVQIAHRASGIPEPARIHGKRRRGSGAIVQQTVRLRRSDWQRMCELRMKEGLSAQEQFMNGLGLLFAQYGLEPPTSPSVGE